MMEKQKDGTLKPIWYDIPGGKCFWNGPTEDGKCIHCGWELEDHKRITGG